eukprot:6214645-Pleurochrysis_carterae.AAC.3
MPTKAVFHHFHPIYSFDSLSPVAPTFVFPAVPNPQPAAAQPPSDRSVRSSAPAAAPPAAAPPASVPSQVYSDLKTSELDHFVVSPETLLNLDRQLMESILSTIESPAMRASYRSRCNKSGRILIRLLLSEANNSSASAGLAIDKISFMLECQIGLSAFVFLGYCSFRKSLIKPDGVVRRPFTIWALKYLLATFWEHATGTNFLLHDKT